MKFIDLLLLSLMDAEEGSHSHKCEECGTVWTHPNTCGNNEDAHKCPQCGTVEWWKYHGEDTPAVIMSDCSQATMQVVS